jgi:hypothetical protein
MSSIAHKDHKTNPAQVKAVGVRRHRINPLKNNKATLRGSRDITLRFRVHASQKQYWFKALAKLGVEDFSTYARAAVERAITQDLRSLEPQWQEFVKAIQPIAKEKLGVQVSDDPKDRLENMDEVNKVLAKRRLKP